MIKFLRNYHIKLWYGKKSMRWLLWPLSLVYQLVTWLRCLYLKRFNEMTFNVPIIVVGNLTVGGVGKTPLVIELARVLKTHNLRVGIVSRGYGASVKSFPHDVCVTDNAKLVGDEPLLLAIKTGCPVVIAPKRVSAVQYLLDKYQTDIIISDDGLQHYAMGRSIEVVVIDGVRGFGNGLCLPAGPLRESTRRLQDVDFVIVNGDSSKTFPKSTYRMDLVPESLIKLTSKESVPWNSLQQPVAAIAGIGNPERFFNMLETLGITFKPYSFPDHYTFKPNDLLKIESNIVMTEKDAVKCAAFATETMYCIPVEARLSESFWNALWSHKKLRS